MPGREQKREERRKEEEPVKKEDGQELDKGMEDLIDEIDSIIEVDEQILRRKEKTGE